MRGSWVLGLLTLLPVRMELTTPQHVQMLFLSAVGARPRWVGMWLGGSAWWVCSGSADRHRALTSAEGGFGYALQGTAVAPSVCPPAVPYCSSGAVRHRGTGPECGERRHHTKPQYLVLSAVLPVMGIGTKRAAVLSQH
jgi:hypothetical protein